MIDNKKMPVALITGATGGLGMELALRFAQSGYAVAVHYHSGKKEAERLVLRLRRLGGTADAFGAEIGSGRDVRRLFGEIARRYGRLDALIHSAGNSAPAVIPRLSPEKFDDVMRVHLKGAFLCTQAAARVMKKRKRGAIVYVGSILGVQGVAGECNYAAAKAGLMGLAKSAARELGEFRITVNVVLPGFMMTAMGRNVPKEMQRAAKANNVLGRWTDPRDTARAIVALCQNTGISAQVLNLDARIV